MVESAVRQSACRNPPSTQRKLSSTQLDGTVKARGVGCAAETSPADVALFASSVASRAPVEDPAASPPGGPASAVVVSVPLQKPRNRCVDRLRSYGGGREVPRLSRGSQASTSKSPRSPTTKSLLPVLRSPLYRASGRFGCTSESRRQPGTAARSISRLWRPGPVRHGWSSTRSAAARGR